MSHPLVLAAVTAALKNLLENGLVDHSVTAALGGDASVSALPPDRVATGPDEKAQLNLFLYQVHTKGLTPGSRFSGGADAAPGAADASRALPRSLEMEYLLTAYGVDDLQTEILLGYGLALLADTPVLSADALGRVIAAVSAQGGGRMVPPARAALADPALLRSIGRVKISPQALQTEEMVNLWSSFQVAYRPSVAYRVSVDLASDPEDWLMGEAAPPWHEVNQQALVRRLGAVRAALEAHARRSAEPPLAAPPVAGEAEADTALDRLCVLFGLSPFERDLLLLCAGPELDAGFAALCADAHGDPLRPYPTFSLALAALPDAHWSALLPDAPLRRRRLVEIGDGPTLTGSPLRLDERILHFLVGLDGWEPRLRGIVDPGPSPQGGDALVPSHDALAARIAALWRQTEPTPPLIQLCGPDGAAKTRIAAAACARLGLRLGVLRADALPSVPADLEVLLQLWEREARLLGAALLVDADDAALDPARSAAVGRVTERMPGSVLLATLDRQPARRRPVVALDVGNPTLPEQRTLWGRAAGPSAASLNGQIERLAVQFDVPDLLIHAAGADARGRVAADGEAEAAGLGLALWEACRTAARPKLDDLAQRLEPAAAWDDLVLPDGPRALLRDIAAHVRRRGVVYHQWGFASQGSRGLGLSALFAGASGTGKTMAAEVLAGELGLDLYRVDLSATVSKFIGETEKNLRRIFDAAEGGGAILLFDEADALFGKRTETRDSHDRYANQEVSYLLQRMEAYRGVAILTTNLRSALDPAFLRRLRYVVQFPFPDAAQREELWRRIFPASAPAEGLSPSRLAQLAVSGGHIRSIALNAAFLAADAEEPIRMAHILRAAQSEYSKLEKTLTDAETAGWL